MEDFAPISLVSAEVYTIPTDQPEADGTLSWSSTTMVVVKVVSPQASGLGWTYAGGGAKAIVDDVLGPLVLGGDPLRVTSHQEAAVRACRNLGRPGMASCAISALDIALWDLKARLLGVSLVDLLGLFRDSAPIYGSGGFTTYDDATTERQLRGWVDDLGVDKVKIKIGQDWGASGARDLHRVQLARKVVGDERELFVDANGAYGAKQAIRLGEIMTKDAGVAWFEEPVSSDDLEGLHQVREHCSADIAAGEYGYTPSYFSKMIAAQAVDCVQVDVTRCGGITDWRRIADLCAANGMSVSGHCAPNLHAHVACSISNLRHLEYFHDHSRIEGMLFEGALAPRSGFLSPHRDVPGHGMALRESAAAAFRVS